MKDKAYDIIVIGAGSGGLSVGLFMSKIGFKVLMAVKNDHEIGGDCLNDGCIPSKALIHVSRIAQSATLASHFGLKLNGKIDIRKAINYVYQRQEIIREHENTSWLEDQGIDVVLGEASFTGKNEIEVNGQRFRSKRIVIATGSKPRKLKVAGIENVKYYDNENIFHIDELPDHFLVIGGGPISVEISQALFRLGSNVTVIQNTDKILEHDDELVSKVLLNQLQQEGIKFLMNAEIDRFTSANTAIIKFANGETENIQFDAVFVGIGRELILKPLQLERAGIQVKEGKMIVDKYLRTSNKNIFVCGDVAGDLQFSHAAEFHARIVLNNLFSPFKKTLNNEHMSWVTFTDPELATFGRSEKELKEMNIPYKRLEQDFRDDDRAIVDNYQYSKMVLFVSKKGLLNGKEKILGGTMVAPHAGEIIQELILANINNLSVKAIFNKVYPYPVASRINQHVIIKEKERGLSNATKKILQFAYKIFS